MYDKNGQFQGVASNVQ